MDNMEKETREIKKELAQNNGGIPLPAGIVGGGSVATLESLGGIGKGGTTSIKGFKPCIKGCGRVEWGRTVRRAETNLEGAVHGAGATGGQGQTVVAHAV